MNIASKRIRWTATTDADMAVLTVRASVHIRVAWAHIDEATECYESVSCALAMQNLGSETFSVQGVHLRRIRLVLKRELNLRCAHWKATGGETEQGTPYFSCRLIEAPEDERGMVVVHPSNPYIQDAVRAWRQTHLSPEEQVRIELDTATERAGYHLAQEIGEDIWGRSAMPMNAVPGCTCPTCQSLRGLATSMEQVDDSTRRNIHDLGIAYPVPMGVTNFISEPRPPARVDRSRQRGEVFYALSDLPW
jgi:hypothetical protein